MLSDDLISSCRCLGVARELVYVQYVFCWCESPTHTDTSRTKLRLLAPVIVDHPSPPLPSPNRLSGIPVYDPSRLFLPQGRIGHPIPARQRRQRMRPANNYQSMCNPTTQKAVRVREGKLTDYQHNDALSDPFTWRYGSYVNPIEWPFHKANKIYVRPAPSDASCHIKCHLLSDTPGEESFFASINRISTRYLSYCVLEVLVRENSWWNWLNWNLPEQLYSCVLIT